MPDGPDDPPSGRTPRPGAGVAAMVGTALRRLWHDRLVAGAAGVLVAVGLIQLAAAPIYADAVTLGSLRWAAGAAPAERATVTIELSTAAETVAPVEGVVTRVVGAIPAGDVGLGTFSRRLVSNSFELPARPDGGTGQDTAGTTGTGGRETEDKIDLTVLASVSGIQDRADLVDGRWPGGNGGSEGSSGVAGSGRPDGGPIAAAVEAGVADRLGLALGDVVALTPRRSGPAVEVEVVGRYRRSDGADRFWGDDPLLTTGLADGRSFRTHGPFVVAEGDLVAGRAGRLTARWLVDPDLDRLTVEGADRLRRVVAALPGRLDEEIAGLPAEVRRRLAGPRVSSQLDEVLAESSRSITVTRAGVLAVAAELTVLAGVALAIGAGLLVEARRAHTAVLQARGAGRGHLVALATVEAAVLVVPAAVLAPTLAAAILRLLARWGPLSSVGFPIEPSPGAAAAVPVAVAAVGMMVLLVAPVGRSARAGPDVTRHHRQHRRPAVQRAGLDVALTLLTAAAFWQLGRLGTGARSVLGDRFAIDPLLILAPALALLTGAVVTLRLVPLVAGAAEWSVARGRSVVGTLAGWQLARRPTDQARSVFLLVLALAIGGFASAYAATWWRSQDDQATQRLGADVLVLPDRRTGEAIDPIRLVAAHRELDGVAAVLPVRRAEGSLPASERPVTVLALDTAAAPQVVLAGDRWEELDGALTALAGARPRLPGIELPGRPVRLELAAIAHEERVEVDRTGHAAEPDESESDAPPEWLPVGFDALVDAVVQDGDGLLHRQELGRLTAETGPASLDLDLRRPLGDDRALAPSHPLTLVALELRLPVPQAPSRAADVRLGPLTVVAADGERTAVPLAPAGGGAPLPWRGSTTITSRLGAATTVSVENPPVEAPAAGREVLGLQIETGAASSAALAVLELRPGSRELPPSLPIVVDRSWLAETGTEIGDLIDVPALGLTDRQAEVVGAVDGIPTVDPTTDLAVVTDLASLQVLALQPGRRIEAVDELWLAVNRSADREALTAELRAAPFTSAAVEDREAVAATLRADPVALAAIGAYVVGAGAAAVFAAVVFTTSAAMSARQRRQEFVLLRALGLSPRQFSWWMAVEQLVLLAVAVVLSTLLGLGLSLAVLPRLLLDQGGRAVVPTPRTVIPWGTVAAVELLPVLALAAVVAAGSLGLRRRILADDIRTGEE